MKIVCKQCQYEFGRISEGDGSDPPEHEVCPRCGAPVDVADQIATLATLTTDDGESAPPPPTTSVRSLGEYEILDEVSRGAMGVVYKARHRTLGRVVALKVLIAGEHASPGQVVRFEKEARAAARLRHPNIVPIYEIGVEGGKRFFTMDFIEGTPLDVVIRRNELQPRQALEIAAAVADALAFAHAQDVIHRDIKPSNIMIDRAGHPQIMDFGLAKQLDSDTKFTKTGTTIGTPSYMSPEQARGENERVDHRSDVYSLGAVTYELLTGRPPFTGETMMNIVMKVIHDEPTPPRRLNPKLHRDIQTIVLKAMEKDPDRRYQSMAALADDIRRYVAGEMITARPAGPLRRAAKLVSKYRTSIIVGLVIAGLASTGFAAFYVWSLERQREAQERARQNRLKLLLSLKDREPKLVTKFRDDFSQPSLNPVWKPSGKEWAVREDRLAVEATKATHVLLDREYKGKVVLEFTAVARSPEARFDCFLGGPYRRAAYTVRFGSWDGHNLTLLRRGKPLAQIRCEAPIRPDVPYRFRIDARNTSLLCRVEAPEGPVELRYDDPALLRTLGKIRLGFGAWASSVAFDDVRIRREEFEDERPNLNMLQSVDFWYLSRGQLQEALAEYKAIIQKHQGKQIAVLAEHYCGLIHEALGSDPREGPVDALRHYENFEKTRRLLNEADQEALREKHAETLAKNRERRFFVLIEMSRYEDAAAALAELREAGYALDAGTAWAFPGILSRCAGDLAYEPALKIMETARFSGRHPTLKARWAVAGAKVQGNFSKALNDLCRGFGDQEKYAEMKRAFTALPDPRAAWAFERAAARAVAAKDAPVALDLLSFARGHGMTTSKLERAAQTLAQQFLASKQYPRITNVHTAYPANSLARYFNKGVVELVRSKKLLEAIALFQEACRRFPGDSRSLHEAGGVLMSACLNAGLHDQLRNVYGMLGDPRFARRLTESAQAQMKAESLSGAYETLEYARTNVAAEMPELPRLAAALAGRFVEAGRPELVLELYAKYPDKAMAGSFARAIEAAARADDRALAERLLTEGLAAFPERSEVSEAARAAVEAFIALGEAGRALRAYQAAAKAQEETPAAAAGVLLDGAKVLLAEGAVREAAAAFAAAARTAPDGSDVAAPALLKASILQLHLGERARAQSVWNEIIKDYKDAAGPVHVAELMTGDRLDDEFRKWQAANAKVLPAAEAHFYLGLRALLLDEAEKARKELGLALAQGKGRWFLLVARAALDSLPKPPAAPTPPEDAGP
jgi:serine/threonine protein kinase